MAGNVAKAREGTRRSLHALQDFTATLTGLKMAIELLVPCLQENQIKR